MHWATNENRKMHIEVKGKWGKNDGREHENILPVPVLPDFVYGTQTGVVISTELNTVIQAVWQVTTNQLQHSWRHYFSFKERRCSSLFSSLATILERMERTELKRATAQKQSHYSSLGTVLLSGGCIHKTLTESWRLSLQSSQSL